MSRFQLMHAYIHGLFNKYIKRYGYGGFIIYNNKKYIIQGSGDEPKYAKMRNVGEKLWQVKKLLKRPLN